MAKSSTIKTKQMAFGTIVRIVLVGCGGTGSILAEQLCRMIKGFRLGCELVLIDGDAVEESNIWRQNFAPHEIGANKAAALALRLCGRFGLPVSARPRHITARGLAGDTGPGTLLITATDTLISRKFAARENQLWIDAGNETSRGQAVIGSTHDPKRLSQIWRDWPKSRGYIADLPNIAAMNPAILRARPRPSRRAGCGQMPFAEQGFGVNAMAAQAAALLAKEAVVDGVIKTAAVYFDAAVGRMAPRRIDRELFGQWKKK